MAQLEITFCTEKLFGTYYISVHTKHKVCCFLKNALHTEFGAQNKFLEKSSSSSLIKKTFIILNIIMQNQIIFYACLNVIF